MAKPKRKTVVKIGDAVILGDGVQLIIEEKGVPYYFTSLEAALNRIMGSALYNHSEEGMETIKDMRKLIKRAYGECKKLANAIRADSETVQKAIRDGFWEERDEPSGKA